MAPDDPTTHVQPDPADVAAARAEQRRQDDLKSAKEEASLKAMKSGKPLTQQPKATQIPAPPPKVPLPAKPGKTSIVQITFKEGMREVEVVVVQDQGTMSPRKIDFASKVLMKKFREHLGKTQAAAIRAQRAAEEEKKSATAT